MCFDMDRLCMLDMLDMMDKFDNLDMLGMLDMLDMLLLEDKLRHKLEQHMWEHMLEHMWYTMEQCLMKVILLHRLVSFEFFQQLVLQKMWQHLEQQPIV